MAQKNSKDRYQKFIDAGKAVSRLTGERFEDVARDLMQLSNAQRAQAQELIEDVVKRSKKSTEFLVDTIKKEVEKQLKSVKVVSKDDLTVINERLNQMKADLTAMSALREELKHDIAKLSEAITHIVQRKANPVDTNATEKTTASSNGSASEPEATNEVKKTTPPRRSRTKTPPETPEDTAQ